MLMRWILMLTSLLLVSSCLSIKTSGSRGAKKLFASYYSGEGSTQYFIKPISFEGREKKLQLIADFTFRYKDNLDSTVTVNYTLRGSSLVGEVEKLTVSSGNKVVLMSDHLRLFKEKSRKDLLSRFGSSMSLRDLKALMEKDQWQWKLNTGQDSIVFESNRKSSKTINALRENLFILID